MKRRHVGKVGNLCHPSGAEGARKKSMAVADSEPFAEEGSGSGTAEEREESSGSAASESGAEDNIKITSSDYSFC